MTIKEMVEVMLAAAEGETVQCTEFGKDSWDTVTGPVWDWHHFEYRIKPKRHETWGTFFQSGKTWSQFDTEDEARISIQSVKGSYYRRMREVIE